MKSAVRKEDGPISVWRINDHNRWSFMFYGPRSAIKIILITAMISWLRLWTAGPVVYRVGCRFCQTENRMQVPAGPQVRPNWCILIKISPI
jgi:hypothetical protein